MRRNRNMPDPEDYVGEQFGDNDVDPEDPSPSQFDEGNGEEDWNDEQGE